MLGLCITGLLGAIGTGLGVLGSVRITGRTARHAKGLF